LASSQIIKPNPNSYQANNNGTIAPNQFGKKLEMVIKWFGRKKTQEEAGKVAHPGAKKGIWFEV